MDLEQILTARDQAHMAALLQVLPAKDSWTRLYCAAVWFAVRFSEQRGESFRVYPSWFGQHLAGEVTTPGGETVPLMVGGVTARSDFCGFQPQAVLQALRVQSRVVAVKFFRPLSAALAGARVTIYRDTAAALVRQTGQITVNLHHKRISRQRELVEHLWARQDVPLDFRPTMDTMAAPTPLMMFPLAAFSEVFAGN